MNRPMLLVLAMAGILSGCACAGLALAQAAERSRLEVTLLRAAATAETDALAQRRLALATQREEHAALEVFLKAWEPHLRRPAGADTQDPVEAVRTLLQREAARLPVATSAWTTPAALETQSPAGRVRVQPLSLRVAGDLRLTLAWLGRCESLLPAAHVVRADLEAFGNGVALEVELLLPLGALEPVRGTTEGGQR